MAQEAPQVCTHLMNDNKLLFSLHPSQNCLPDKSLLRPPRRTAWSLWLLASEANTGMPVLQGVPAVFCPPLRQQLTAQRHQGRTPCTIMLKA